MYRALWIYIVYTFISHSVVFDDADAVYDDGDAVFDHAEAPQENSQAWNKIWRGLPLGMIKCDLLTF